MFKGGHENKKAVSRLAAVAVFGAVFALTGMASPVKADFPEKPVEMTVLFGGSAKTIADMPSTGALLSCQPSAPSIGWNPLFIWNRVDLSCPHQPPNRGRSKFEPWRSWTKIPPTLPGLELRYL